MSTSAPIACSMCYGSGYNMAGQPCSCGSLRTRILSTESEIVQLRAENAELREKIAAAEKAINRCYKMLLSEPDTKGALFKAENILREALADAAIAAQKGEK